MKAFLIAVVAAVALAVAASYLLAPNQRYAYQAFATDGARVSQPGTNLVGPAWTGDRKDLPHDEIAGDQHSPKDAAGTKKGS